MLSFHTTELINVNRHPRPVQNIYKQVPVFQAMPYILRMCLTTEISPRTFKVPIKGNGTHHKADEREGRKQLIRRAHCGSLAHKNEDGTREGDFPSRPRVAFKK
jgi:hypothetical protein